MDIEEEKFSAENSNIYYDYHTKQWYKLEDKEDEDDGYQMLAFRDHLDNKKIHYDLKFYNGGCCFEEALKESLKKMRSLENK